MALLDSVRSLLLSTALCAGLSLALGACATAGEKSNNNNSPDAAVGGPSCGDNTVDVGEDCDGTNLNGADCASQGYAGGILACNVASCTFSTANCYRCGDNTVSAGEDCDGTNLDNQTCQGLGYLGGDLRCDPADCTFDISTCQTAETLQNDNGNCPSEVGCSNADGTSGNPQNLVECFNSASLQPPFSLTQISYTIGTGLPAPVSLNAEVYDWNGSGPPGALVASEAVPAAALGVGPHTLTLSTPAQLTGQNFCVGLNGTNTGDAFRILFSDSSQVFGTTYIRASVCGANDFTAVANVVRPGNWCMTATIDKAP